jgi:hypothetical protein
MSRTFPALCLASTLALAGSVAAQQPSPGQPARNDGVTTPSDYEQTGSKTGAANALTLTGCLDRAPNGTYELRNAKMAAPGNTAPGSASGSSAAGISARADSNSSGSSTTDRSTGASGSTGATGTSGTVPSGSGASSAAGAAGAPMSNNESTWILKSSTDLAPHVGHQVQITGHPSAAAGSGSGSASATTSNPTTTATGPRTETGAQSAHSVEVQAVRMISQSCQ